MNIIETVDFNDDTQFLGKDLDISWAYLQTKKLFELGDTTITSQTFKQKVIDQYNLNKNSGIAEASDLDITRLPGDLADGALPPRKKINFQKQWLFNTPYVGMQVYESMLGEFSGTLDNAWWTGTTDLDQTLIWIASTGKIELDDRGSLRSDRNWTLYIKGEARTIGGGLPLFRKGNFEVVLTQEDGQCYGRVSSSGVTWGERIHNYFEVPFTPAQINNQELEASVVREGLAIRLYINGQECYKSIPGDQPDPIWGVDKSLPIEFSGNSWVRLDRVYITELDFVGGDVVSVDGRYVGDENSYSFAHDMDLDNSFFAFKQYFPDRYGSFARIFETKYGDAPEAQTHWVEPPSLDVSNGYVAKDKCLMLSQVAPRDIQYMTLPSLDFSKDFTLSFWIATVSTYYKFLEIIGEDGNKLELQFNWEKTEARALKVTLAGTTKFFQMKNFGAGADVKWQHITIVKNGDMLSIWGNKQYGDDTQVFHVVSDQLGQSMGSSLVRFNGGDVSQPVYLSHIRMLGYAVSHIPKNDIGKRTSWSFVDALTEPIEPGRVGNA